MELVVIEGVACVKRSVDNIDVYSTLSQHKIQGIPSILRIDGNTVFYQYVNGVTLRELLQRKNSLTPLELTSFIYQTALILKELKDIHIVHKDLKPENIIITQENKVYLIDFNVSRIYVEKESDTTLFGTRGYASPEHFGYSSTSFKSDMYSLGKIIEELDVNFYYRPIAQKCTEIDPVNRYDNYTDIILDLDSKQLEFILQKKKKTKIINILKPLYSKKIVFIYFSIYLLLISVLKSTAETLRLVDYLLIYFMAPFLVIDLLDYIRFSLQKKKRSFLGYKFLISSSIFFTFFLMILFFSLFK